MRDQYPDRPGDVAGWGAGIDAKAEWERAAAMQAARLGGGDEAQALAELEQRKAQLAERHTSNGAAAKHDPAPAVADAAEGPGDLQLIRVRAWTKGELDREIRKQTRGRKVVSRTERVEYQAVIVLER